MEDEEEEELNSAEDEERPSVTIKKIMLPAQKMQVAQMGSKTCLVCGRNYRYSHNARRHELTAHNYDRYTNKVTSPSPPPTKLRPNPLNPKARLLPNPVNPKIKMLPKSKVTITPTYRNPSYPVRIKSLADLQSNPKQPEILKTLLTRQPEIIVSKPEILLNRPEIIVSTPEIMRSGSESPETLISEPELAAFQVETIISEPDTYINQSGESEDEEDNQEQNCEPSAGEGDNDDEVDMSSNIDINKIIGVESQESGKRDSRIDSAEHIIPDTRDTDDEAMQNENYDEGDDGENYDDKQDEDETGNNENENGEEENEMNYEDNESRQETDLAIEYNEGQPQTEEDKEHEANGDEAMDEEVYPEEGDQEDYQDEDDDDGIPVALAPIVEINENIENHDEDQNRQENGDEAEGDSQGKDETTDNKEDETVPLLTMTPNQKEFIIKHRDVIEQINTLKCLCCGKLHPRRKAIIQHLQKNGVQVPKHTCYNCVITFGHIGALLSHMRANVCTDLWRIIFDEGGIPDSMVAEAGAVQESLRENTAREDTLSKAQYKDILNSRSYACKLCPAKFQLKQFIMKHIIDVHENGGQRVPPCCIHCKYRFKDNKVWKKHIRNGECTVHIACELCNEKFRSLLQFNDHALSVHAGGFVDQSSDNLNRSVDGRPTDCPICHKNHTSYHNLVKHLKAIHNEEKPHMCQHCDSKFESVTDFNHHLYMEHSGRVPNGDVDQSGEVDTDGVDLSIVKQEVTTYNYSCTDCASMFDSIDSWTQHQIDEHNHKAYECDQCEKKFLQDSELIDHKNAHLRVKFYSCTICSNSYSTPMRLSEHMAKTHPREIGLNDLNADPFYCEMCVRSFKSRQAFSNHMRIHSKIPTHNKKSGAETTITIKKPAFTLPIIYRNSPKSVLDAPYSCDICGKGFLHKKNIWKHKKVLHPEVVRRMELEKTGSHFMDQEEVYTNDDQNSTGLSTPQFDSFLDTTVEYEHLEQTPEVSSAESTIYQCDLCDKKFAVKSSIWKHKRVKHGIVNPGMQDELKNEHNRTSCTICKLNFPDKKAYYRHRKTVHKVNIQTCKICGKSLNSTLELYEHYKTSHAKELLGYNANQSSPIKIQPETVSISGMMEDDEEYQESDNPEEQYQARYPCDSCGKIFLGMNALQNHDCVTQNSSNQDTFDCEICNKSYTSISALKSHRGWHLRSPDGKAAFSSSGLWMPQNKQTNKISKYEVRDNPFVKHSTPISEAEHLQIKRKLPPDVQMTLLKKKKLTDEVTVELVQTVSRNDQSLLVPQRIVTDESSHFCHPCGKGFSKKAAYLRHVEEVHRPNSVFCPICNKSFTRKSTLLMHMQKHGVVNDGGGGGVEGGEEEGPLNVVHSREERFYNCDLCNVRYTTAKSLRRHCMKHHNVMADEIVEERPAPHSIVGTRVIEVGGSRHKCGQCGEMFASERDMWQHRHFPCDQCGMFFSRQQYLTAHVRARHQDSADKTFFPCNMCDRFYMNKKSLQRHIEVSH